MAYFVMEGVRKKHSFPQDEFALLEKGHIALMAKGVEDGVILFAGPRLDADGGFVLMRAKGKAEAEAFFDRDPFKINDIQSYHFKAFDLREHNACIDDWLNKNNE